MESRAKNWTEQVHGQPSARLLRNKSSGVTLPHQGIQDRAYSQARVSRIGSHIPLQNVWERKTVAGCVKWFVPSAIWKSESVIRENKALFSVLHFQVLIFFSPFNFLAISLYSLLPDKNSWGRINIFAMASCPRITCKELSSKKELCMVQDILLTGLN